MYARIRPLLFALGPEQAHLLASTSARMAQKITPSLLERVFAYAHPALSVQVLGLTFTNPVGLAAGFDKNARLVPFFRLVGAGFTEVGSVTAKRSRGNKRPRLFRFPEEEALVNRMGLGNHGAQHIAPRLKKLAHRPAFPMGVNIAKTHSPNILGDEALEDFATTYRRVADHASYITLNVSCPNTAEGKTFEDPAALDALLREIDSLAAERRREGASRTPPLLVKLSPPERERFVLDSLYDEILAVCDEHCVDGFVATNTLPHEKGGLSGPPLAARSTSLVRYLYNKTGGTKPIIGVGGIDSAEAAYDRLAAGASLVQLYTGLVYHGPGLISSIKQGLVRLAEEDRHSSLSQVTGCRA